MVLHWRQGDYVDRTDINILSLCSSELVTVRIKLKLSPEDDVTLAQVEHAIWAKQKRALGLPGYV